MVKLYNWIYNFSQIEISELKLSKHYENALKTLNIDTLDQRREKLCLNFAIKCTKNQRTKDMFPLKTKVHNMKSRNTEKYQVQYAHTERFQKSPIIHMHHLLNQNNHWHSNVEITHR